jgi:hypothetical protein
MKYLILCVLLSGCATEDFNNFGRAMAAGGEYQQQQQQQYQEREPAKQVDMSCKRDCLSAGYSHPLCDSKCSY